MLQLDYVIQNLNKSDGTVLGYVSSSGIIDGAGEVIPNDEFVKMVDSFMTDYGQGKATLKANHEIDNVGTIIQSVILDTEDNRKKWLVEIKLTDLNVKAEVDKSGVSGFSIGGSWDRITIDGVNVIGNIKLAEFSILYPTGTSANRPANPESVPIMKAINEAVEKIINGIKSLTTNLRGSTMSKEELESMQTSLKTMNDSLNALAEKVTGYDAKIDGLKAEFQKSLDDMKSAIPETITGIVTPLFEDHKAKQSETVKAMETEMKKSVDEKVDEQLKAIAKSAQTYTKPPEPDRRTSMEKAVEWRNKENMDKKG